MAKRLFGEPNKDNLGDLLVAFFQFYSREFRYATEVVSLRSEHGLVSKHEKGWLRDVRRSPCPLLMS
jgi:DNA polymerase sigma